MSFPERRWVINLEDAPPGRAQSASTLLHQTERRTRPGAMRLARGREFGVRSATRRLMLGANG